MTTLTLQILTKVGVLNVPAWYAAGKVSAEQSNIDWRESPFRPCCCTALQTSACHCTQALAILVVQSATLGILEVACESHTVCSANFALQQGRSFSLQAHCCSCSLCCPTGLRSSGEALASPSITVKTAHACAHKHRKCLHVPFNHRYEDLKKPGSQVSMLHSSFPSTQHNTAFLIIPFLARRQPAAPLCLPEATDTAAGPFTSHSVQELMQQEQPLFTAG